MAFSDHDAKWGSWPRWARGTWAMDTNNQHFKSELKAFIETYKAT